MSRGPLAKERGRNDFRLGQFVEPELARHRRETRKIVEGPPNLEFAAARDVGLVHSRCNREQPAH